MSKSHLSTDRCEGDAVAEKPKETGSEMVERWRRHEMLWSGGGVIYCGEARALPMDWCADELATFLEGLRELSAEFRGKVVNVKSGYWKDKPTEMTKKYKEIADTLDALIGERVTEGSEK